MEGKKWSLRNLQEAVLDLLFPPKCPFCGKIMDANQILCAACQKTLPWLTGGAAEKEIPPIRKCASPLRYQEAVRTAIHAYKFNGRSPRSRFFGVLLAQCAVDHALQADLVSWPPLSAKRLKNRGYDQAGLLAETVGKTLSLPVRRTLVKREIPAQSGLSDEASRRANVRGAYTPLEPEQFQGKSILLVDDVVTTGSTLAECANVLQKAGAAEITCVTLARAR